VLTEPKSNFLETILSAFPPLPLPDNFRFRLFGPAAFTPGPDEAGSTFPSSSSSGLEDCADGGLGSFEGCVGFGRAKKYGWFRAYMNGDDEPELECSWIITTYLFGAYPPPWLVE